jgi:hypothetical protein
MAAPDPGSSPRPGARTCGPCNLCCRLPAIDWPEYPELAKPADAWCRHCLPAGAGCAIHAERPMHCAAFQCLWLMGFGPEEMRPDLVGGYLDATDAGELFLLTDRARPDPRTNPVVARFVEEWTRKRRARLVVYRAGKEVREGRSAPRRRPGA